MAFDLALTSIAHIPKITGGLLLSKAARSEWDPVEEGEEDLVSLEFERGDMEVLSVVLKNEVMRDCLSQCIADRVYVVCPL